MSDQPTSPSDAAPAEGDPPEVLEPDEVTAAAGDAAVPDTTGGDDETVRGDAVTEPAKVMRIGSMVKQLLEEVRSTELDEPSRERLAEVYERSIVELSEALSPDLQEELRSLALPFEAEDAPSGVELRIAKAQLVGWLEGLFHGIQASLMAQQLAARQQLDQMRQLPGQPPGMRPAAEGDRPGTYL